MDNTYLDDHTPPTHDMIPGFKPFKVSILIIPVWKDKNTNTATSPVHNVMDAANRNHMNCDSSKCKEFILRKKGYSEVFDKVENTPQYAELPTFYIS